MLVFFWYEIDTELNPSYGRKVSKEVVSMSRDGIQHGLAVVLWIVIGGAVGFAVSSFTTPEFRWIGLLVGAVGAYISTDFDEVRSAAATVWGSRTIMGGWVESSVNWFRAGGKVWIERLQSVLFAIAFSTVFAPFSVAIITVIGLTEGTSLLQILFWIGIVQIVFIAFALWILSIAETVDEDPPFWTILLKGNAVYVYGWMLPRSLVRLLHKWYLSLVFAAHKSYLELKSFLRLIHSERRVVRAFDAILGMTVSFLIPFYWQASPQVILLAVSAGAAIGFVVAIIHYEYIAVRWLKVMPNGGVA